VLQKSKISFAGFFDLAVNQKEGAINRLYIAMEYKNEDLLILNGVLI